MDFSVDKTKKVLSEVNQYQMAALKAVLLENHSLAREWYLAADVAAHFLRRKKGCELLGTSPSSLTHQVARLMLSAKEQQARISSSLPKKKNEARDAYHYWMACSQTLGSSNLEQLLTHLEAIRKKCQETFPGAIPFLQEAEGYFKTTQGGILSSEQQLLSYYWSSLIYDAFFLATSNKVTPLAEEILLARKRVINAIQSHHHQRAHTWSLIAFLKGNIFETFECPADEHWKQMMTSLEEKLLNGKEGEAWQRGFYWLFIAVEAQRRRKNFHLSKNELLITAHQQTANYASLISKRWQRVSNLEMGKTFFHQLPFFSKFLPQCWTWLAGKAERRYRSFMKMVLLPEVTFCIPPQCIPTKAQEEDMARGIIHPQLQYTVFYNWIYQTWHFLTQAGISCQLSKEPLCEGIVVTLGKSLPPSFQEKILSKKIFLVDVVADNHPYAAASLHLIQNKIYAEQTPCSLYLPHWPQPYLIPRDSRRKNRFENICFFGHPKNLASEFQSPSWQERLQKELGLTFKIKGVQEWHDYSNVDCILAIRDFSKEGHLDKPGTKLYNAWLAGVPFMGGNDTAYAADGRPGKDYLVATSLEEVFQHLRHLKEDEAFRGALVEEGKKSATGFTQQATLEHWKKLVLEIIPTLAIKRYQKAEHLFKFAEADNRDSWEE
jgi:hypothetical protein